VHFDERDVVRHALVQRIVKAYERHQELTGAGRQLALKLAEPASELPSPAQMAPLIQPPPAEIAGPEIPLA